MITCAELIERKKRDVRNEGVWVGELVQRVALANG